MRKTREVKKEEAIIRAADKVKEIRLVKLIFNKEEQEEQNRRRISVREEAAQEKSRERHPRNSGDSAICSAIKETKHVLY